jgi:D-serine deaminase-like pyridoxal phosphate-dependent protein
VVSRGQGPRGAAERDAEVRYARLRAALGETPLPAVVVDVAAFDANLATLAAPVVAAGKRLRIASKSLRVPALLRRALEHRASIGVMTYAAAETLALAEDGFGDLLLAYPTVQRADVDAIAGASRLANVATVCDDVEQLEALAAAGERNGLRPRVVVDVDMAYRPLGAAVHLGVRRSPLRSVTDVLAFVERARAMRAIEVVGAMGYEAQIAGLGDDDPRAPLASLARRALKARSIADVAARRAELAAAFAARGWSMSLFNGGGSGSVSATSREPHVTEVTIGSGLLASHLFDHYRGLPLRPACFFALQVVRRPSAGVVTCLGGGWVASGPPGADRLPIVALPAGARLLPLEGAGEVQTPIELPPGVTLPLGAPVFFRHAKAGELAEHVRAYVLAMPEGTAVSAPTYRGLGHCFLG